MRTNLRTLSWKVPAGNVACFRPARRAQYALRYRARKSALRASASMRLHLLRQATRGRSPRRGSPRRGVAKGDWRSTARRPSTFLPLRRRWRATLLSSSSIAARTRSRHSVLDRCSNPGSRVKRSFTSFGMSPSSRKNHLGRWMVSVLSSS